MDRGMVSVNIGMHDAVMALSLLQEELESTGDQDSVVSTHEKKVGMALLSSVGHPLCSSHEGSLRAQRILRAFALDFHKVCSQSPPLTSCLI